MSDIGRALSGGTPVWKKALDPKRQFEAIKETGRKPGAKGVASAFAGTQFQEALSRSFSGARKEVVGEETATVEAEETARIEKEKAESAAASLKKKRGLRSQAAKRTGRRASIITGPMGTPKEPEVRRATLG